MDRVLHLVLIIIGGVILADLINNATGTKALFTGFDQMFQIFINPTNTKGL
jgi:hypothetical protein